MRGGCYVIIAAVLWMQVTFPELAAVEEAAAALDAWKARARDQAGEGAKAALPVLEALMHDASALAVACNEVQSITQTVTAAQKWVAQVLFLLSHLQRYPQQIPIFSIY